LSTSELDVVARAVNGALHIRCAFQGRSGVFACGAWLSCVKESGASSKEEGVADTERTHITWRRSTASGSGNCVEVASADESVLVRNSRDPFGPVLSFSLAEWAAFLERANKGEFAPGPASD
jgi:hypothetical protein